MSDKPPKRRNELTCTFHIGGKQVERLTDAQLDAMAQKLSKAMNRCYQRVPSAFWKTKTE